MLFTKTHIDPLTSSLLKKTNRESFNYLLTRIFRRLSKLSFFMEVGYTLFEKCI